MNRSKVEQRFDRLEAHIDNVYDMVYGAVDTIFYGVDRVFTAAKKRALAHATGAVMTPIEKAQALADYYDEMGAHITAAAWRKTIKVGLIDVDGVEKEWERING